MIGMGKIIDSRLRVCVAEEGWQFVCDKPIMAFPSGAGEIALVLAYLVEKWLAAKWRFMV
jgi:hypothetical protein